MSPVRFAVSRVWGHYVGSMSLKDRTLRIHWQFRVGGLLPLRSRVTEIPVAAIEHVALHTGLADHVLQRSRLELSVSRSAGADVAWAAGPGGRSGADESPLRLSFLFAQQDLAFAEDFVEAIHARRPDKPASGYAESPFAGAGAVAVKGG